MRNGRAFVISAPSGAGKTTLLHMLLAEFPRLRFSVSCTTRAIRQGETDGRDYYFLDKKEFARRRDAGEFAEWAQVHDNFYGTPLAPVQEMLSAGMDVVFDIDVQGAAQLKLSLPQSRFIFILPSGMAVLRERLAKRGQDSPEALARRIENARGEIRHAMWFDAVVINDDLQTAYQALRSIYIASTLAPAAHASIINSLLGEENG